MQEHPVPRQITTFEFKLIGQLTIKQFGYLGAGAVIGVVLFFLVPRTFLLNFLVAAIPIMIGAAFAFVPINDRPMDVWLKNLFRRLVSPTQYYFHKNNLPPKILLGITLPPKEVLIQHIRAQQKLSEYMSNKPKSHGVDLDAQIDDSLQKRKKDMQIKIAGANIASATVTPPSKTTQASVQAQPQTMNYSSVSAPVNGQTTEPNIPKSNLTTPTTFNLDGHVYSPNGVPLESMLVYLKQNDAVVRLFKTDRQGSFKNNIPLSSDTYFLEIEDPQKKHQFARMKIDQNQTDLKIFAQK